MPSPLICGSTDRREEWISIDAVDVRLRVDLPDGSAHIAGATTEIQRANGLAARKRHRQRDELEVSWLRGALLGPPQLQQFVDVVTNARVDLSLADGRGLHLGWPCSLVRGTAHCDRRSPYLVRSSAVVDPHRVKRAGGIRREPRRVAAVETRFFIVAYRDWPMSTRARSAARWCLRRGMPRTSASSRGCRGCHDGRTRTPRQFRCDSPQPWA